MAVSETLGLAVAIEGFRQFQSQMGDMNKSIEKQGKEWSGMGGIAGKAMGVLTTGLKAGIAVVGTAGAAVAGLGVAFLKLASDAAPLEGIGQAFDIFAGKFGVSLDAMREAAKGTISDFDLMKAANIALTGAGADLGKEFGEALPSLLEAARAAAKATGQDVDFLFNSLVTGIKRGSPMLIDNTGLVLKLGEANEAMAKSLGKSVDELTAEEKQIAILRATMEAGARMSAQFGSEQLTAAERMAQLRASMANMKDQIGLALLPAFNALLTPIAELGEKYGPMIVQWGEKFGAWLAENLPIAIEAAGTWLTGTLIPAMQTVWQFIQNNIIPILTTVWEWLKTNIPAAIETSKQFWNETLLPVLNTVWDFIKTSLIPIIETVAGWFDKNLPESTSKLTDFWQNTLLPIIQDVQEFFTEKFGDIKKWVDENMPLIQSTIETVMNAVNDVIEFMLPIWGALFETIWGNIKIVVDTTIKAIQGIIKTVMQLITGDTTGALKTLKGTFDNIWWGIRNIVLNTLQGMKTIIGDKLWEAWKVVVNMKDKFIEAGHNIIEGIKQGIKDKLSSLASSAIEAAKAAIRAIKDALGIGSPSTVFAGVGQDMMAGIMKGISDLMPAVNAQVKAAVNIPAMQRVQMPSTIQNLAVRRMNLEGLISGPSSVSGDMNTTNHYYNLTTQSLTPQNGLRLEFQAMQMATR